MRTVAISLFNVNTQKITEVTGGVAFDDATGSATQNLFLNHQLNIGLIPSGKYEILVKLNQYLAKLILNPQDGTNAWSITEGQMLSLPVTTLIPGDTAPIPATDPKLLFGDN